MSRPSASEPRVDTWDVDKGAPLQFAQAWFSDDLDGELHALARCRVATATPVTAVRPHPQLVRRIQPPNLFLLPDFR
jgi:hypothetical protein